MGDHELPGTTVPSSQILAYTGATRDCRVKVYDFRRPDKFSKEQIRTLAIVHETFARLVSSRLTAQLRTDVEVRLAAVDQLTYEEFIASIPNSSTMAVLSMAPLRPYAVLELDPAITFAMLDRLFGGSGRVGDTGGGLTNLEEAVVTGLTEGLTDDLAEAWRQIVELEPQVKAVETNPQFAQIVPPREMIVLVTCKAKVNEAEGMLNLCIPFLTVEPILGRLSARYMYSRNRRKDIAVEPRGELVVDLPLPITVAIDAGRHSLADLACVTQGDLLPLPEWDRGAAFLECHGGVRLELTLVEEGAPETRFSITGGDLSDADQALVVGGGSQRGRETDDSGRVLRELVDGIRSELAAGFSRVERRLDDVTMHRDELSDQAFLSSGEGGDTSRPFPFISVSDSENLLVVLRGEHPQLIAMVLSFVDPAVAAFVLSGLPDDEKIDVTERIYRTSRVAPAVLRQVERVLEGTLSRMETVKGTVPAGRRAVVDILNLVSRSVERTVITALDKRNPGMSEDIKQHMFVFEDITVLDRQTVARVCERAAPGDLALSLKAVPEDVRRHVLASIPTEEQDALAAAAEALGPVRLSEVEAAQQRVVSVIRTLEEEGSIIVARPGEDEVIE
jgi:flagellar motor switch protein FliM